MNKKDLKKKYLLDQLQKEAQSPDPIIAQFAKNRLNGLPEYFVPINVEAITKESIREDILNCGMNSFDRIKDEFDIIRKWPELFRSLFVYQNFYNDWLNGGIEQYLSNSGGAYLIDLLNCANLIEKYEFSLFVKKMIGYLKYHIDDMCILGDIRNWLSLLPNITDTDIIKTDNLELIEKEYDAIHISIENRIDEFISLHFHEIIEEIKKFLLVIDSF